MGSGLKHLQSNQPMLLMTLSLACVYVLACVAHPYARVPELYLYAHVYVIHAVYLSASSPPCTPLLTQAPAPRNILTCNITSLVRHLHKAHAKFHARVCVHAFVHAQLHDDIHVYGLCSCVLEGQTGSADK